MSYGQTDGHGVRLHCVTLASLGRDSDLTTKLNFNRNKEIHVTTKYLHSVTAPSKEAAKKQSTIIVNRVRASNNEP